MSVVKINDRKLLRLVDKEKKSQSEAAKELGVTRQAVSKRLQELRGRKTRVVAAKKIEQAVNTNFDAMTQLLDINKRTISLLDEAEQNPELSLKCIAEIRNQIKLASDIYQTMYSIQVVDEFMQTVTDILKDVDSDVFQEFKRKLNGHRSLRSALRIG
jgi:predicted transcriptional regulator